MAEVDVKRIVADMASKHGIRLDVNDPAISLVLLNRLVVEHSADDLVAGIRASMHDFEEAVRKVQTRAGQLVAAEFAAKPECRVVRNKRRRFRRVGYYKRLNDSDGGSGFKRLRIVSASPVSPLYGAWRRGSFPSSRAAALSTTRGCNRETR